MNNFRGRVDAKREPVPDTVRDNELASAAGIESGPVSEHGGSKSQLLVQHQLSAMSVAGKRQR